ncbi:MAG: hypothetical protein MJZ67_01515 [Bacteroidales bacterium]|nr:hypothetical protein [Bacteroidales bacterium]
MKKLFLFFAAILCVALTSCIRESSYTINFTDDVAEFANVTVFEYDYGDELLARREIKDARNLVYEFTSYDGAYNVVIGVEAIVNGRIMEWYSADIFKLDPDNNTDIEVNFRKMNTQDSNPMNPADVVSRYLY